MELAFEWDKQKAKINQRKHNISFEEASTVFDDPLAVNFDDPDHSTGENRYLIIGLSDQSKFLFVSYTDRDHKIRLISARLVTPTERRYYERENPR
ncbi:MAG: BrnT family toxin [Microcystis sp.]|uniref:BrnT family toxin n=1 Tax=Microcystis sp. TaxID=1127 RepID=UPI00391D500B